MGKSHAFVLSSSPTEIVCAFTVSNDVLRLGDKGKSSRKAAKKDMPQIKQRRPEYPAVKIGRLGVVTSVQGKGIGSQLMDFIKGWFSDEGNKTGCRFITVDAYNNEGAIKYYIKNGFDFLFPGDKEELEYIVKHSNSGATELKSKYMYFDLARIC